MWLIILCSCIHIWLTASFYVCAVLPSSCSETKRSVIDTDLPKLLLKFCRQVAEGLSYLAGKSFVHRDIAARNILLDQELNCKVRMESEDYRCRYGI